MSGVAYLHHLGIVHRDIKPENIVIDGSDVARLCDFGIAERDGELNEFGKGTLEYMAPELLETEVYGSISACVSCSWMTLLIQTAFLYARKAHDIWALGVTLFFMVTGEFPWEKCNRTDDKYAAFKRGDLSEAPWRTFSPALISVGAPFAY